MSAKKGYYEDSPPFKLFNYYWNVYLYPGGVEAASSDDTVSIGLHLQSKGEMSVRYLYIVRDASGDIIRETRQFEAMIDTEKDTWVLNKLLSRSTVLEKALNNGTFTIELRMAPVSDSKSKYCKHFIPANRPIRKDNTVKPVSIISSLLFDEESADICFDVSSPSDDTTSSVKIYAHRVILKARAPDLFRLCAGYDVSNPMPINDVEPYIFRGLMCYIYGLQVNDINREADAKALLEAANKYDVANLKVTAEAWYVNYFEFTAENVADQLLYADAMSCPLLKEEAINFIVGNGIDVFSTSSFNAVLESRGITREILQAMAKKLDSSSDSVGVDSMSINDLRIRLNEYSLAVDGDREILVRRFIDLNDETVESQKEETQEEAENQEDEDDQSEAQEEEDEDQIADDAGGDY